MIAALFEPKATQGSYSLQAAVIIKDTSKELALPSFNVIR